MYIKHLFKAKAPTSEDLSDEKYIKFIQDVVDVYGIIHARYIRTPEGKYFIFISPHYNFKYPKLEYSFIQKFICSHMINYLKRMCINHN
jgi:hypothetical protein